MVMKLYGAPTANVQRAILPFFEAEVDSEDMKLVMVNMMAGEHKQPSFLAKQEHFATAEGAFRSIGSYVVGKSHACMGLHENLPILAQVASIKENKNDITLYTLPFGLVPYFEDGDVHIFESRAIARYVAEKYQGHGVPLIGKTPKENALINQWCEVEGQNFAPAAGPMLREIFLANMQKRPVDEEFVASCMVKLEKVFDIYEAQLSKSKYLAGDKYSLADVFHTPVLARLKAVKPQLIESQVHVKAWAEDIMGRPAFVKTLETNSKWAKE